MGSNMRFNSFDFLGTLFLLTIDHEWMKWKEKKKMKKKGDLRC